MERNSFLVETSWLAEHLHDPDLRIVDMRGYVRTVEKDGIQEALYEGARDDYERCIFLVPCTSTGQEILLILMIQSRPK